MPNKIRVYDVIAEISPDWGFENIVNELQKILVMQGCGEWIDIEIQNSGEYEDAPYSREWRVCGYRIETDEELKARVKLAQKMRQNKRKAKLEREEYERKEYERLKAKYG